MIRKREIVRFFHDFLDLPYGAKARSVKVPQVIIQSRDKETYSKFLRGLFDTDGCLNFSKRYAEGYVLFKRIHHIYPRIFLSTVSMDLANDVAKMLDFLDIHYWRQVHDWPEENWSRSFRIRIRGEEMLRKWIEKIGFKNPVQLTRYELWKRTGFCPPDTTLEERIQMLEKK